MPLLVSHSTLLFFSGDVLCNSGEIGAELGVHPGILCLVESLCSLLAGNKDNPFSSQPSVCSASMETVTLHWVSVCCLGRSCKPRLVGHMVFAYNGLICIHKHQVLCSRSCASLTCPWTNIPVLPDPSLSVFSALSISKLYSRDLPWYPAVQGETAQALLERSS